jgi:hypothetical protein
LHTPDRHMRIPDPPMPHTGAVIILEPRADGCDNACIDWCTSSYSSERGALGKGHSASFHVNGVRARLNKTFRRVPKEEFDTFAHRQDSERIQSNQEQYWERAVKRFPNLNGSSRGFGRCGDNSDGGVEISRMQEPRTLRLHCERDGLHTPAEDGPLRCESPNKRT